VSGECDLFPLPLREGKVNRKYLPLYVVEFQFRHNNRENVDIFGAAIAGY